MAKVKLSVEKVKELQVGEIKYKDLISSLEMDNKRAGNPRNAQLRELRQYMDIQHIKASRFIINEIYEEPIDKIDGRGGNYNKRKPIKSFEVDEINSDSIGIYSISLGRDMYIGSTSAGFRKRFLTHRSKSNDIKATYNMLKNPNARFRILEIMDGATEPEIRKRETYYMNKYESDNNFNLINKVKRAWSTKERNSNAKKKKFKSIKVFKDDYSNIIKLLEENGYKYI